MSTLENNTLLEKEDTTRENRIWVRIAAACNVKCVFCLDADAQNGKLIDDELIRTQMRDGYKVGMKNRIIISGGEASIHPKFHEYIKYAHEIGYDRVQTVTNGNRFSDLDFCKRVCDAGLNEVTFSIHGHTKSLHDYLTGAPGSYDRIIRGLLSIKKYFPKVIVNIDVVVNKTNVSYLAQMIRFFRRLGVNEFDILQIIPFGRGFKEYKDILFYDIEDHLSVLHETWDIGHLPGVNMWTNRFPVEAFEGYEDFIQDPRKIKSETMGDEGREMFDRMVRSGGEYKPDCFGDACEVCFLRQYCHDYINHQGKKLPPGEKFLIGGENIQDLKETNYSVLRGEEFPSQVYEKYGKNGEQFLEKIRQLNLTKEQKLVNIPRCIRSDNNHNLYEWSGDLESEKSVGEYTKNYIMNLYRKKSLRCKGCKYNDECEGIHINFIRSYGFQILQPITE